jgi:hypothetical protein
MLHFAPAAACHVAGVLIVPGTAQCPQDCRGVTAGVTSVDMLKPKDSAAGRLDARILPISCDCVWRRVSAALQQQSML